MIHSPKLLLLAPILSALAQDLPTDIVGCTDLACPNQGWDSCTVTDEAYAGIGLARISGVSDSLEGISLVKGVHIEDPEAGGGNGSQQDRTFKSAYYLGTPSGLEVSDLSGCAVVFNDPPTGPGFQQPKINDSVAVDIRASYGTCPDVITQGCIDSLTRQARNVQYGSAGCSALKSDLEDNPPDECSDLTGAGDGLGRFDVVSLSNLSTISQSANGSSDCWPVLPKSDSLAQLYDDTAKGNYTEEGNLAEMYKITPILTVFTASNGSDSLVSNTSASLTCLKVVSTGNVTNATDPEDTDEGAAAVSAVNIAGVSVAGLATLMFVLL